ncbi:MAG: hypothetical protein WA842_14910 [Croceibacterium sp.]
MRKFILAAGAALVLATPAAAQDATGTVTIGGTVAGRCMFTVGNDAIIIPELAQTGTSATAGRLDPATVNGQSRTLRGWCNNAAAGMTVEAFPLLNAAATATGFTNRVNYTATATANGFSANDTSLVAGLGSTVSVGMFTGDILVGLSDASAPADALLVAGAYTGRVEVTLTPTFTPPA